MSMTWTKEQQKVIDLRNRNILVSAAAGSGKTAVLEERIIAMLTRDREPVDVDRLLIVTFTEAAAAEMKERIRNAIEKKLEEYPQDEHLKQQATLIHNAQITTIHSFCLSVIRDHFPAISIDPGFRVGEEGELKLLRHDVLEEILEEKYQEADQRFLDFTDAYGSGKSDKKIEELILKIYEFSRSYPDADGWLDSCVSAYEVETVSELENSPGIRIVMNNVRIYLEDAKAMVEQGLMICQSEDGPMVYENALLNDHQLVEELLGIGQYRHLSEKMQKINWVRLAPLRDKSVSEEKAEQVKLIREEVKGVIKSLVQQYFYQDPQAMIRDLKACYPAVLELTGLVKQFAERFEQKKRAQNMIDFSDMEQYALQILTRKTYEGLVPSAIAEEYQQQFLEIMIDEYQDSNLIQETILNSISTCRVGRYNVFMVGDVKQSIYRFRLSRPELFLEKFNTYDVEDSLTQRIDLHKNFRSRKEVLESVNDIFRQIMTKNLGGIVYDDQAALYPGAEYPAGEHLDTEVLVIDRDVDAWEEELETESAASDTDNRNMSARELEARAIAGRIRTLIREQKVVDKKTGKLRPARYSDIVILTRSIRGYADVFTEVLSREGIPACAGTREGYFGTQEIGVILDYLRVLDNRKQDIPFAAVLTSPVGGLSEEELAVIRSFDRDVPFYQAASEYRMNGTQKQIREKLERCLGQMERFRIVVPYTPMHELLWKILEETGYGDFVSAMPGGGQRRANLEMLIEKARAFESTSYKGLFHFIRYIEQLQKYDVDYGEASMEDEQSDTVRIMTIHKSKGLEFPIVIVAGMGKRFNLQDARSSVVLHAGLGIGLDAVDLERRTKSPGIIKKIIQKEEVLDSLGEELRVLYVAFTRAKEKLILTGTLSNVKKKMEDYGMARWQGGKELTFERLSTASSYWDWVLPALLRLQMDSPITFQILTIEDIVEEEVEEEAVARMTKEVLEHWDTDRVYDQEAAWKIQEQFSYEYPYATGSSQKLKYTVSELKKRAYAMEQPAEADEEQGELLYEEPEAVPLIPGFLQETEELTGASRGTVYHRVMELLEFSEVYDEAALNQQLKRYVETGKMTQDMADCIGVKDILYFLNTQTGQRMRCAAGRKRLRKEQPFVLGVDADELYPGEQSGDLILVQGIIDVYFEEDDGLIVLDYKTDKIYDAKELADRYRAQLDYYAKALTQMTGKPVKEKIIYSFTMKKEIFL